MTIYSYVSTLRKSFTYLNLVSQMVDRSQYYNTHECIVNKNSNMFSTLEMSLTVFSKEEVIIYDRHT